jgi:hypothetical protein
MEAERLKEQVEELTRKLEAAETGRRTAEGKLATANEARERASQANWRFREVEKKLRADLAKLNGPSGPVAQLRYVKQKLTAVGEEARAMYATAAATISTQAQAVRGAGDRVAVLEAMLGPDLSGRPFAELLVQAADALDAAGGGPLALALRAKAGEVEAVQAPAQAPVQLTPAPEADLLQRLLALLEHEALAEIDYQPDRAAFDSAVTRALFRVRDALGKLAAGAAGYPFLSVTRSERWSIVFHVSPGSPEEAKVFAACDRWGIILNFRPPPGERHRPGETRPLCVNGDDPAALERFRLELAAEGVSAEAQRAAA